MDSLANLADNQTDLVDILPDGEARASASSLSLAPADVSSPTYKRQTETATDPPGRVNHPMSHTGKTAASLSGISENHPQEDVSEFGSLSTVPPSLKGRLCVEDEMNTEPILGAWDCPQTVSGSSVHNHIGSRGPKSSLVDKPPHIADGLSSTSVLSYPTQENGTSESHKKTLVISNSLTEQSLSKEVGQTPDNSGHLRPLSGLSSGLTLSDTVMEPLSELYIFESETQDSLFTPQNHSSGIQTCSADHPSVSQQGDRNTHTLSHPSSEEVLTQSQNQLSMTSDSDGVDSHSQLCQNIRTGESTREGHAGNYTSVFDVSQGEAEVRDLSSHARLSDSPNELWLDACQYLTSEDNGNGNDVLPTIFDKWGNSVLMAEESASRDSSCPLWDTKASGYLPEEGDGIGWSGGDTRGWGQPVERWSSVDSWASALSDWAAIITAPPVEITAAFTEIGAEIDALTQALADSETETSGQTAKQTEGQEESRLQSQTRPPMAIQDQELEPQNRQETSIQGRKSCLSWSLTEPTKVSALTELEDREATKPEVSFLIATAGQENKDAEQTKSTQGECSLRPLATQSSLTPSRDMLNSPGDVPRASSPAASDDMATDLTQFAGYADGMDADSYLSKKEESIFLHITEDVDGDLEGENSIAQLKIEEPCRDGVYKVTEERRALGRHELALRDSCLSETPAVGRARGAGSAPSGDLSFSDAETPTSAHVPAVDATSGLCPNSDQHVSKGTLLSEVHNSEPARGRPRFIMPLAPLVIGPPLFRRANIALEGDQDSKAKKFFNDNHGHSCPRTQAHVPLPTLEGITGHLPLEGHKEKQSINDNSATNDLWSRGDNFASITSQGICDLGRELSNLVSGPGDRFLISPKDRVAVFTLDLDDPLFQEATKAFPTPPPEHTGLKMPHKTHKSGSDLKTRPKKEKPAAFHPASQTPVRQESLPRLVPVTQAAKKHESHPHLGGINTKRDSLTGPEGKEDGPSAMINPVVVSEKVMAKSHGKKKKKHSQNATVLNKEVEPLIKEESGAKQKAIKGKTDFFEDKLGTKAGSSKEKIMGVSTKNDSIQAESVPKKSQHPDGKACPRAAASCGGIHKELQPADSISQLNDDVIKRRRLSKNKFGKILGALEKKLTQTEGPAEAKRDEPSAAVATTRKKAYSEVVKQKTCKPQEDPKVMQAVQAAAVSGDPQSLCLWCQFSTVFVDHTATWSRDGTALAELKRSAGDESRVSLNISRASHKDLGKYQCRLNTPHGAVTLDYLLTYEVLSEIVIPASPKNIPSAAPVEIVGNEEDVHCSSLLFRDDFLTEQFFGENQPASIITEKVHFGEGMHRRAFRTKLQAGLVPQLSPGHHCVLKVHNAISHGTKNNEELVQRNFSLAVEECHVQNTAREYIKAYTAVAQSAEAFGDVPEIIPIYLVHRPSNDIPYATLEEELFGDFVKYSVRDGKEINVMRRESEAGQKCCAFQHWVYHRTEGNLLVTDMQGVGMRLTDVGIATCKKGHKGFKGNCATSFIDQFKVLHQCNKYCEILGLKSLQPKPKKTVSGPKGKPQPSTPRKTFGPTVKGKS